MGCGASDTVRLRERHVVPEPTSWATMVGGFGPIGSVTRSWRKAAITLA